MTIANLRIIFALLVLLLYVTIFLAGNRYKKNKKPSLLAVLSAACIVAGIFFGNLKWLGYSLLAGGVVLAVADIIVKARGCDKRG
jgi:apolipoprotein N-acyltransferase